jgi:hypothetical protein
MNFLISNQLADTDKDSFFLQYCGILKLMGLIKSKGYQETGILNLFKVV